jgi:hypothetical protein
MKDGHGPVFKWGTKEVIDHDQDIVYFGWLYYGRFSSSWPTQERMSK